MSQQDLDQSSMQSISQQSDYDKFFQYGLNSDQQIQNQSSNELNIYLVLNLESDSSNNAAPSVDNSQNQSQNQNINQNSQQIQNSFPSIPNLNQTQSQSAVISQQNSGSTVSNIQTDSQISLEHSESIQQFQQDLYVQNQCPLKEIIKKNIIKLVGGQLKEEVKKWANQEYLNKFPEILEWIKNYVAIGNQKHQITDAQQKTNRKNINYTIDEIRTDFIKAVPQVQELVLSFLKQGVHPYIDKYCLNKNNKDVSKSLKGYPQLFKEYCRFIHDQLDNNPQGFKHLPKVKVMYNKVYGNGNIMSDNS